MQTAIICSQQDTAGLNIKDKLLQMYDFKEEGYFEESRYYRLKNIGLYTTEHDSVDCENVDEKIDADLFVFATKHESKAGIPSLCVHTQGNWGSADYGGKPRTLCVCPASYLKEGFRKIHELAGDSGYDIIQEVTHHGPFLEKPSFFIEIGSNKERWEDESAARIIAKTIMHLIEEKPNYRTAIGIGGLHHSPNFKKIILDTDIAMGHICPKYQLKNLDIEMVNQAIAKTRPSPEMVILDWKGLSGYKNKMKKIIDQIKLPIKRTSDF